MTNINKNTELVKRVAELESEINQAHIILYEAGCPAGDLCERIKGLLDSTTIGSWQVDAILNELRALIARSESEGHDQSTTDS